LANAPRDVAENWKTSFILKEMKEMKEIKWRGHTGQEEVNEEVTGAASQEGNGCGREDDSDL